MNIKTIKQIDVFEWDNLVEKTYSKIYSFQQQDGCQSRGIVNISVPSNYVKDFENTEIPFEVNGEEMGVSFETWLNTTPEETRNHFKEDYQNRLFWNRNFYPSIDVIINDLHSKGLLEEGEYQINIDW
jgi:hypothetical protein